MSAGTLAALIAGILALVDLAVKVAAVGLVPEGRRPSSATAWLLAVLFVPFVGIVAFLLIGSPYVDRGRRRIQDQVNDFVAARVPVTDPSVHDDEMPEWVRSAVQLNQRLGTLPLSRGNVVDLYPDYGKSIEAMAAQVRSARDYVHVEFYIMAWDDVTAPFFEACAEAVQRGVPVRVLFDHLGSRGIAGHQEMLSRFDAAGFAWHRMLPVQPLKGRWRRPDLRNHRKILVVDGQVGHIGSQNLVEPSYHKPKLQKAGREWHELTARVEGPVVASLDAVFATDWFVETGEVLPVADRLADTEPGQGHTTLQVVPSGPGFPQENNLRLFNTLIYGACRRLSLTSPYFVPDESLLYAVTTAAQRGVKVELFVSEEGDQFMVAHAQMSYYRALLEAGVRIYLYPVPYVLHAKHFTVDDQVGVIGSSNMDMRSFGLNFEVSTMGVGPAFVSALQRIEDSYRAVSRELTLEEWGRRPLRRRYVDNVMRLTSALQ